MEKKIIELSPEEFVKQKVQVVKTTDNSTLKIPYIEFTNPIFIEKKHKIYTYQQCFQIEKLIDPYYEILCLDGNRYLYDACYHTVLGKIGKRFQKEEIKDYYQSPEAIVFSDKKIPYQTRLFRKIKPIQDDIARLYLLDGSRYYYDTKRNEVIGHDNQQLDRLKDCHISHLVGHLYAISSQQQAYVYDVQNAEIIGSLSSLEEKGYRKIPNIEDVVVGIVKEGEFLYHLPSGKILTPIFSMIHSFEIYNSHHPEYCTAQFKTYLKTDHRNTEANYISGIINLDGSFVDKAITCFRDGRVTIYSLDNEVEDEKQAYQNILYNCKQPVKVKKK